MHIQLFKTPMSSYVLRKVDYWVEKQEKQRTEDQKQPGEALRRHKERKRTEKERENNRKFQFIQNVRSPKKNNEKSRYFSQKVYK